MNATPAQKPSQASNNRPLDKARDRLVPRLESLVNETRELLAYPDLNVEAWEGYGRRRKAAFTHLEEMDFQALQGEEAKEAQDLLKEILQQDAIVTEKLNMQLVGLRKDLTALAKSRQALRGYTSFHSTSLLECSA